MSNNKNIKASKFLSFVLRHQAEKFNLQLSDDGYAEVNQILSLPESKALHLDDETIIKIVNENDKKRFQITERYGKYYIRALQGHTIHHLDDSKMFAEIKDHDEYETVVHGTFKKSWEIIMKEGLNKMKRNHIHFAIGYPNDKCVISGMRRTCEVFIELDMQRAMNDGIKFLISENKVILSSGINGVILPKYFKRVVNKVGVELKF
jgi:2'-phosphotransferase